MDFSMLEQSVWERLKQETRPIVLYGMGNGADRILEQFHQNGIQAAAVFASDEFVRGHSFHGWPVQRLTDVVASLGEGILIVIAFASHRPEVLQKMYELDARFDVVAPDLPVAGDGLFDADFVRRNDTKFNQAYALFAEEQSRSVFLNIIRFKLSGKLQYLRACETDKSEIFQSVLKLGEQEHFVDLGAYCGDTMQEFLQYTNGRFASVTALEPDEKNFRKLSRFASEQLSGQITLVQAGAWSADTTLFFSAEAGRQSHLTDSRKKGKPTPMRTLDSVLNGQPCTFLKLDVEGAEREALIGASHTLRRFFPKLNIAAYHRNEDLFALPLLVHQLCPAYELFLRHHPAVPAWDTNLYARLP